MTKEEQIYVLIQNKASSNQFVQGLSGLAGFPWTLLADAGVIITHYAPMLNKIRLIYGRSPMAAEHIKPVLEGCKDEIIADILVDKLLGQIPLIGIVGNIVCAKTMTWRLGLLFGVMAVKGETITTEEAKKAMIDIRNLFPQENLLMFTTPPMETVTKLLEDARKKPSKDKGGAKEKNGFFQKFRGNQ